MLQKRKLILQQCCSVFLKQSLDYYHPCWHVKGKADIVHVALSISILVFCIDWTKIGMNGLYNI